VQQLSFLLAPQFVWPTPPSPAQLAGGVLGTMTQLPDEHVPEPPQVVALDVGVHDVVLVPGWQLRQAFVGQGAPLG
jgi:hypothetical protein